MPTIKVQHPTHGEIDVAIPDEYVHQDFIARDYIKRGSDELKSTYMLKAEVDRRFVAKAKAAEDPAVIEAVKATLPTPGKTPARADEALQAQLDAATKAQQAAEARVARAGERLRDQAIEQAARQVFSDDVFANPFADPVSRFRDNFEWDWDLGYPVARVLAEDGSYHRVGSNKATPERPFRDPAETFSLMVQEDAYKAYARPAKKLTTQPNGTPPAMPAQGLTRRSLNADPAKLAQYVQEHGRAAFEALPLGTPAAVPAAG